MRSTAVQSLRRVLDRALEPGLLALLTAVSFRRNMFGGAVFPWDYLGRQTAGPTYVSANIANGNWPSWNPFQGSGAPMATDIGAGLYYPMHWVTGWLGIPLTLRLQTLLQIVHVWAGAVGALLLARALGARRSAALLAATGYVLFGGFYGQASHSHHVRGFAFLPWLLLGLTMVAGRFPRRRLVLVPVVLYLVAAGAYPGQLIPFMLAAGLYCLVQMRATRSLNLRNVAAAGTALAAGVVAALVVIYPFISSQDLLHRAVEPTISFLRRNTYSWSDIGRAYLNWGSLGANVHKATWVATPLILGLVLVRRPIVRRHSGLVAVAGFGLVALVLPSMPFMASLMDTPVSHLLYTSRFPGADYKSLVVLAAVVLSAAAWDAWFAGPRRANLIAVVGLAVVLLWGASRTVDGVDATIHGLGLWTVVVAAVLAALAVPRLRHASIVGMVVVCALVVIDGTRLQADAIRNPGARPVDGWTADLDLSVRGAWERGLAENLEVVPTTRPGRTLPIDTDRPQGRPPDAFGFIRPSYNMGSYGGHQLQARIDAYDDDEWFRYLAGPTSFQGIECDSGCDGDEAVRRLGDFAPTSIMLMRSYGLERASYQTSATTEMLVIENEIDFPGWMTSTDEVSIIDSDLPVRLWRVEPGNHSFIATHASPFKTRQILLSLLAVALGGAGLWLAGSRGAWDDGRREPAASRRALFWFCCAERQR